MDLFLKMLLVASDGIEWQLFDLPAVGSKVNTWF